MASTTVKLARKAPRKLGKKKSPQPLKAAVVATSASPKKRNQKNAFAAWSLRPPPRHWVPQETQQGSTALNADAAPDRFDVEGTTGVNELVLRHGTMPTSDLKTSACPALFRKSSRHTEQRGVTALAVASAAASAPSPSFSLDRYLSNLVRALVHPLHNFLQCHHGLHNADEVQVMLMPRDGPLASAASAASSSSPPREKGAPMPSLLRRCYVATNHETLTEEGLQDAVRGWGVAGVFQISEFVLVRGEKGRHAEQKLLDHLRMHILLLPTPTTTTQRLRGDGWVAEQKVLVVGERLPCVACRLFAILYEDVAVFLPSHGHMYLSTIPSSLAALESSEGLAEEDKAVVREAYADPAKAARLLFAAPHRRVLR